MLKIEPDQDLRFQHTERGSLDQQSKGSLKMELGSDSEPVKIEFLR